jgi:hypothetical protein
LPPDIPNFGFELWLGLKFSPNLLCFALNRQRVDGRGYPSTSGNEGQIMRRNQRPALP